MQLEVREREKLDRLASLGIGEEIQTSLKSKKLDDAQETFKAQNRKKALMEAKNANQKKNKTTA